MNNITFCTVKIKNFMSVRDEVVFDYRNLTGLTYVYGENKDNPGATNGSGKSATVLYALLVALFGKTINNINNAYLFNRQASAKEKGYIELDLIKNSIDQYKIFVELKPNRAKTVCSLNFCLYHGDKDITKSTKAETMKFIEDEILGCSFEVFKNTVVMSSSNILNFFEMPRRIKNEYLQGIFSLSALAGAYNIVVQKGNQSRKEVKDLSDSLLTVNSYLEKLIDQDKSEDESLKNQLKNLNEDLVEERKNLENLLNKKIENSTVKDYEKKVEFIGRYDELIDTKKKIEESLKKIRTMMVDIKSSIKANKILLSKHQDVLDLICEDCLVKVNNFYRLNEINSEINELTEKYEDLKKKEEKLEVNFEKAQKLLLKVSDVKIELNEAKSKETSYKQTIKASENMIQSIEKQIEFVKNKKNPFKELIASQKEKKEEVERSLSSMQSCAKYYGILKEIFSDNGVKQIIISKIIEVLNSSIHSYLRQMGADFLVYFDDKLVYEFETPSGPCEYASFSAGERRKLDLAVLFAFRDVLGCSSLKTNVCIIDEILDSAIDTATLNSIISILKNKSSVDNQAIIVISHREGLSDNEMFVHKVRIEKENGHSKFIQEI